MKLTLALIVAISLTCGLGYFLNTVVVQTHTLGVAK